MIIHFLGMIALIAVLLGGSIISYFKWTKEAAYALSAAGSLFFLLIFISTPTLGIERGSVLQSSSEVVVVEVKGFPLAVTPPKDEKLLVGDKVKLEEQDDGQWIVTEWLRTKKYE